jgi:alcohol dehydrogenase
VSAFSERVVVDRSSAVTIPEDIPFEIAALFGCALLTGAGAVLNTAGVRAGESVAVIGLGGVGLSAVLGATAAGAGPVIAVDPVASKRELALSLGVTAAFAPDDARAEIENVVPGGVQYAVEAVGSAQAMELAFEVTCRGGTTVAAGLPDPSRMVCLPAAQLVTESRSIMGSYMGSARPKRDIPRLIGLWERGRLPVEHLCGTRLDLYGVASAFDALSVGTALRQIVVP